MITLRIDGATHHFAGPNAQADADAFLRDQQRTEARRPPPAMAAKPSKAAAPHAPRKRARDRMLQILGFLPASGATGMRIDDVADRLELSWFTARNLLLEMERGKHVASLFTGQRKRYTLPAKAPEVPL